MKLRVAASVSLWLSFIALSQAQVTDLGGGITTRLDVGEYADLSLDLRDIRGHIASGSKDQAVGLYLDGENSELTAGRKTPLKFSSEALATATDRTPWYLFHLYGLSNLSIDPAENDKHLGYADTFIQIAFEENLSQADEAVLSLGMWMYATHLLYDGAALCEKRTMADNPNQFDMKGGGVEEFIALWIGRDQEVASTSGNSLYAWAQVSAVDFGTADPEAPVNSNIKTWYQEAAAALSIDRACTSQNKATVETLYSVANRVARQMVIPLYQRLLQNIIDGNAAGALIYGRALIPQLSKCRGSTFKRLQGFFLTNDGIDLNRADDMIRDLKESYSCFGISCADIGSYNGDSRLACSADNDDREHERVAGFLPPAFAEPLARIDLDVRQLKLMTELEAFPHAKMLYSYGGNALKLQRSENDSISYHSLSKFATSADRQSAGAIFTEYLSYHNNQLYSHNLIMSVLDGESKWQTPEQRGQVIGIVATHQIVFITIASLMRQALTSCRAITENETLVPDRTKWDEAMLLIVGSLEGRSLGGSPDLADGEFVYGLANRLAFQFDTRNEASYAKVNSAIEDLVYAGRAELEALDCDNFERSVKEVESLLYVAKFQATISSAIVNQNLRASAQADSFAQGESFANCINPAIQVEDPQIAEVVSENMVWRPEVKPVRDGAQEIGDALGDAFQRIIGLRCATWLGNTGSVDPCRLLGVQVGSGSNRNWPWLFLGVSATVAFLII